MPNISKLILIRDILQITPLLAVVACSSNTATQADASVPSSDASGSQTDAALADATSNEDGSTSPQDAGVDAPLTASEKTWCDAQQSHGTCPNAIAPSSCSDATKCRARQFSQVGLSAYVSCYSAPSCKTTEASATRTSKNWQHVKKS